MKPAAFLVTAIALACMVSCSKNRETGTDPSASAIKGSGSMIGMTVPGMKLPAWHRDRITIVDTGAFRGRWLVLFFYPADFTIVCPTELKELAEYYGAFTDAGAEIISVSTDSEDVHRAWHRSDLKDVRYPMASDRAGKLCRILGTYDSESGRSMRATFLVDPDGRIVAYEFHHDAIGRSADELLRKLSAAIAVRKGQGGYCPAGWKQGDEILHPGRETPVRQ